MSEIKWIKMSTEVFDNRKIRQIEAMPEGDSIIVIWFKLLCLAGNVNDKGYIYITQEVPYTEHTLSVQFNRPLAIVQLALRILEQFGMIEIVDDILCISNWEKYQSIEKMEKIREQTRNRVAKYRENQKKIECNVTCNADVTQCNATDIDKDIDIDKEINNTNVPAKRKNKVFVKPTIEEIKEYCKERGNSVNANTFYDFYESKGWLVGKNKMKDWKACVRTWEGNRNNNPKPQPKTNYTDRLATQVDTSDLDFSDLL